MNKIDLTVFNDDFSKKSETSLKVLLVKIFDIDYKSMLKLLQESKEVNYFLGYPENVFNAVLTSIESFVKLLFPIN
jgi:hypothetical protein